MLGFDDLIWYSDIRLAHKMIHHVAAAPLQNFVQLCSEQTNGASRSASSEKCSLPKGDSTSAQSAFSHSAIKDWNKLPINLKICTDQHSVCRCNTNQDRLHDFGGMTAEWRTSWVLVELCLIVASQSDAVPDCINSSVLTVWSKTKRLWT